MEQIGPYEVVEELGRGGMGVVYEALAPDGQRVAIKVLLQGRRAPPAQRRRFEREVRALAKVEHQNVVRLLDVGEHRGAPYLVTEFHQEGSLSDTLRATTLSPPMAARLGCQLAAGLAAAHALGVIHRDVKPDNVLLASTGRALLTDFGLVKDLDRQDETQRLTSTGVFLGSPGYWAPEQAAGKTDLVGPASDVYGLGATLYAALTGQPPILGETLIEVFAATASRAPIPIRSLRPDIPQRLESIVLRCLEKDPADRWPSVTALGDALRETLANTSPSGQPKTRRPALILGVALSAFALSVAALVPRGGESRTANTQSPLPSPAAQAVPPGAPRTPAPSPPEVDPRSVGELSDQAAAADVLGRTSLAAELWRRAADKGSAEGMYNLGIMLAEGRGVPKDEAQAVLWYRRAVEKGHALAMNNLGTLLSQGLGVPQDQAQAVLWYRRGAEAGSAEAMFNLGLMLAEGLGAPKDEAQAATWYRRGAEAGSVEAMLNLGNMLEQGRGVPKDEAQAATWYRRSAEAGRVEAMLNLGLMLERGRAVAKDEAQAATWYRRGAEGGYAAAMASLGAMLLNGRGVAKDEAQAATWYRRAAREGYVPAILALGNLCEEGRGVPQDEAQAVTWYRRAAEEGEPRGMFNLGVFLAKGLGAPKDEARAVTWYRRAAEKGHAGAMNNLGIMLEHGRGVPTDKARAITWYRRAAEKGDQGAMCNVGLMLEHGRGVAKDEAQAVTWYRRAAEEGHVNGMKSLGVMLAQGRGVAKDEAQAVRWLRAAAQGGDDWIRAQANHMLEGLGAQ